MKQYCRYCAHLVYGDVCYCEKKNWVKTYSSCKQRNKCKDFIFNPIDALAENLNGYKPREEKQIERNEQTLFDFELLKGGERDELLNCPFCGGEAKLRKTIELVGHGTTTTSYFVECVNCKVRGNHFDSWLYGHKNAEDKAVEFWNTRTKERGGEK